MLLRLSLALLVVVTSLSLGMARGQLRTGHEVILCGGAVVIDDPQGGVRYCPDMAAGLLMAVDAPPMSVPAAMTAATRVALSRPAFFAPTPGRVPQARGPPLPAAA